MSDLLQSAWKNAATQLGLQVEVPFVLCVASGELEVPVLLKDFGDRQGMLIFTNWNAFAPFAEESARMGYGYSCLSEPRVDELGDGYTKGVVGMLEDWGWAGNGSPPEWFRNSGVSLGLRNQFFSQLRDESVPFCYNDSVEITEGEYTGVVGAVASLVRPGWDGLYLIEVGETGEDIQVPTKSLRFSSD